MDLKLLAAIQLPKPLEVCEELKVFFMMAVYLTR